MSRFDDKVLKGVLLFKMFLLVLVALLLIDSKFYVGEKTSIAKDTTKIQEKEPTNNIINVKDTEVTDVVKNESNDNKVQQNVVQKYLNKILNKIPFFAKRQENTKEEKPSKFVNNVENNYSSIFEMPEINISKIQKEELNNYLSLLEQKKIQIENYIKILKEKEENIRKMQDIVEKKLAKIQEERKMLADTLQKEKEIKEKRVEELVNYYKKMAPKKVASILEKVDKDLAVALFKKLPQKQVMEILGAMSPEKSAELTEYYGRVNSAKEYQFLKELNEALNKEFNICQTSEQLQDNEQSLDQGQDTAISGNNIITPNIENSNISDKQRTH